MEIYNDVLENTMFLLFDQPYGEANTMGTLTRTEEATINEKQLIGKQWSYF